MEHLTINDRFNEYVMTGLRTVWGISLEQIEAQFGMEFKNHLLNTAKKFVDEELLFHENETIKTTKKGKFLAMELLQSYL